MSLEGTGALLRQALRRDRVVAPAVVLLLALVAYASAAATGALYGTGADQVRAAVAIDRQPAIVALYGRILDVHSLGELAMTKMTVLYAALASALFVLLVRRHTRVEEESGRAELIGATPIGRDAPLAAAVSESLGLALGLGALVALACVAGGLPLAGSAWFGVVWAGTGLVATGIAAVTSQVAASARTCASIAAGALGGEFAVRAAGDASAGAHWLGWLSPLGWNTQLRAWSGTRPWVALLYVVVAAGLVATAQWLRGRRDLGSGLVAARPGRAAGASWLRDPVSLGWRVHRGPLALWSTACLSLGVLFGAIAPGLQSLIDTSGGRQLVARLGGALVAAVLSVGAMVITAFAVTVITHAAGDEAAGRAEQVLATGASRARWFGMVLTAGFGGAAVLLALTGGGLAAGGALAGADAPWRSVPAALGWVPAAWLVASLGLLAWSCGARWASLGWVATVAFLSVTLLGELLRLPHWFIRLSPYSAVPSYPAQPWHWTPVLVLLALSVAVAAAAWFRFRTRDVG